MPLLKEIEASGGMSAYVDAQPDLCGGLVETFKLQCFRDSVDEVVDAPTFFVDACAAVAQVADGADVIMIESALDM